MIRFVRNNRGNILLAAMAAIAGIFIGIAVYGTFHEAEAILGVTDTNNPHNLSAGSSGIQAISETRICIFCHTSHNANMDADLINAPLWNHSLSDAVYNVLSPGTVVNSSTKYSLASGGVVNMLSSPSAPDGTSRLCLGCHDGTVSIGSVGSEPLGISMNTVDPCLDADGKLQSSCSNPGPYIGNDLTTKHVISIPMNGTLISASRNNCFVATQTTKLKYPWDGPDALPATVILRPTMKQYSGSYGISGLSNALMPTSKYSSGYYYGVQCSTCHDPHKWAASGEGDKFIVTSTFDALCKACHTGC